MDQVTVSVVSTSLNIGLETAKLFSKYSRFIIHIHKWDIIPPERIYIDMICQGTSSSPAQGCVHLFVYGTEGKQNDVESAVLDNPYTFNENHKMTFQADVEFEHGIDAKNYVINGVLEGGDNDNAVHLKQLNADKTLFQSDTNAAKTLLQGNINTVESILLNELNERQKQSYYNELFEFYFDMSDPNQFDVNDDGKITGMNNNHLIIGVQQSLSDFNVKDDLKIGNSRINLSTIKAFTENDDYTIFVSFKHDTKFASNNYKIGFGHMSHVAVKNDKIT